jgi:hypothetical protein
MRKTVLCGAVAIWLAVLAGRATPAEAAASESSFTSIAEKGCRKFDALKIDGSEYAISRVCPGRGGYKVYIDEEDLRETLTVGMTMRQAGKEPAASDRFGAFNGYDDRIEWRSGSDGKPYAVIAGWSFADNGNSDTTGRPESIRMLVVMRLPPGPVCKIAYVDRAANSDADELARKAADDIARNFKCGTDAIQFVGKRGAGAEAIVVGSESERPKP